MLANACAFDSSGFASVDEGEVGSGPGESVTTLAMTSGSSGSSGSSTSTGGGETSTDTSTATTPSETSAAASSSESGESDTTGGDPPQIGPFAPPVALDVLNSLWNDDDPTVRLDYLEIYFVSDRPGGYGGRDIWRATRLDAASPWDMPVVVAELNTAYADSGPELSSDGLRLFMASDRLGGAGGNDIYVAVRTTLAQQWQAPVHIGELATPFSESSPTVSPDLLEMFYCATVATGVIQRSTRASDAMPWLAGAPVFELDDPLADDCSPFRMTDGVRVAFSSNRLGGLGAGDLFVSSRAGGVFAAPTPIEGVNDLAYEDDPWIAPDGALIVFASNRGEGDFDLWAADAMD
jgi:hypothetical protein